MIGPLGSQHGLPVLHRVRGIVRRGRQLGRTLGYPTANLELHNAQIVDGIYVSLLKLASTDWLPALTFIGSAKTFGETTRKIETYILDWDQDIYGQWCTVDLLEHIRENQQFASVSLLQQAMNNDVTCARSFFRTHPPGVDRSFR